jgi:hypothetical protein
MKNYISSKYCVIIAAVISAALSGCGDSLPKRVPVSGRVLIDGKPLEYGTIQVVPDKDRPATGQLGPGGKFTLTTFKEGDGCVLGKHKVAVISREIKSADSQMWHAPKKYILPDTSGIEVEITGPRDDLEINLKWDGGKPFLEKG